MKRTLLTLALVAALVGCQRKMTLPYRDTAILPNSDPALRKTWAQFAEDAKTRMPYPADAPTVEGAPARALVGYDSNSISLVNYGASDQSEVDVWLNGRYVAHIPTMQIGKLKKLPFKAFFDDAGTAFPNKGMLIEKVELVFGGNRYPIVAQLP